MIDRHIQIARTLAAAAPKPEKTYHGASYPIHCPQYRTPRIFMPVGDLCRFSLAQSAGGAAVTAISKSFTKIARARPAARVPSPMATPMRTT